MTATETFEPANFDDFSVGDRARLANTDNGYGGSGETVWRTGTVTKTTPKTITVACNDWVGKTAVLRRSDWHGRAVSRAAATQTPYSPEGVAIVDMGDTVWALYIPDPEMARDPQLVADNLSNYKLYRDVEMVASMTKHYVRDGAAYSGWIVDSGGSYSDPIRHKRDAQGSFRRAIRAYFTR